MLCRSVLFLCFLWAATSTVEFASLPVVKKLRQVVIRVDKFEQHTEYVVLRHDDVLQKVTVNHEFGDDLSVADIENGFELTGNGQSLRFEVLNDSLDFTLIRVHRNLSSNRIASHCRSLDIGRVAWYGGPELYRQFWPIEKLTLTNYSMVTKEEGYSAIAERYWLNSKGLFIYVDQKTPLFANQNVKNSNLLCLTAQNALPYNIRRDRISLVYYIGIAKNARLAHMEAVNKLLMKPTGAVNERMIRHPIWSTWARYKRNINESIVETFGNEILSNGFNNSQLEIDDNWEKCYGSLTFSLENFPNIKNLIDRLKARGFRVTLWVHPFINKNCEPWYSDAKRLGFLAVDHKNNSNTQWWNSEDGQAACIDFTNAAAANWYTQRLKELQIEVGIDSFKFDAGESSWTPKDSVLNSSVHLHPSASTVAYVNTASKFGSLVEVRSQQNTQNQPIFTRMMDKDSKWTFENGLPTLITTLLQLNLVGYPYVLPDMIGGNGYKHKPNKELFIRWLQATVFMPCLQYSFVPWDYDRETIIISHQFTQLHANITPFIIDQMKKTEATGVPVNLPIWWLDPEDTVAQQINDEFLLGTNFLAAPVIVEGAVSRNIYLPRGQWLEPKSGKVISGPTWLMNYPAPIYVLPYFVRQTTREFIDSVAAKLGLTVKQ